MLHSRLWEGTLRDETKNGCVAESWILDFTPWIPDSSYQIPDALRVEFGFRIATVSGIPVCLSWIPYPKAQGSGFQEQKLPGFRIPQVKISRTPMPNPDKLTWVIWWANDPFWSKDHVLAMSVLPVGRNAPAFMYSRQAKYVYLCCFTGSCALKISNKRCRMSHL